CAVSACSTSSPQRAGGANPHYKIGKPYTIAGRSYTPVVDTNYNKTGTASWYGSKFHGRPTANGERFDKRDMTAAHKTLPLPSIVRVTNLENRKSVILRVNDRGPFVNDRIIDVSEAAAQALGFRSAGLAKVRVEYVSEAALPGQRYSTAPWAKTSRPRTASVLTQPPVATSSRRAQPKPSKPSVSSSAERRVVSIDSRPVIEPGDRQAPPNARKTNSIESSATPVQLTTAEERGTAYKESVLKELAMEQAVGTGEEASSASSTTSNAGLYLGQYNEFSEAEAAYARANEALATFETSVSIHSLPLETYRVEVGPFRTIKEATEAMRVSESSGFSPELVDDFELDATEIVTP
ncbi:MAG: septal ring lytic transglycosylase RlpA family protein, partial [Pseudomonadota bacterium]